MSGRSSRRFTLSLRARRGAPRGALDRPRWSRGRAGGGVGSAGAACDDRRVRLRRPAADRVPHRPGRGRCTPQERFHCAAFHTRRTRPCLGRAQPDRSRTLMHCRRCRGLRAERAPRHASDRRHSPDPGDDRAATWYTVGAFAMKPPDVVASQSAHLTANHSRALRILGFTLGGIGVRRTSNGVLANPRDGPRHCDSDGVHRRGPVAAPSTPTGTTRGRGWRPADAPLRRGHWDGTRDAHARRPNSEYVSLRGEGHRHLGLHRGVRHAPAPRRA
jgi:hypothetical protein